MCMNYWLITNRCVQMNGWSQQLRLSGHCAPLCLLTSRLIHKSLSASEAALDRPSGEVADAACQKPIWGGGGLKLPGKVAWKTLDSGEMAKRKCQVGARKENCQNKWASEEKGLPSHGNWKRSVSHPNPVPPPCILICTVAYLMQLVLLYPLALTAQVIE